MAFTKNERRVLTVAYDRLRQQAESAGTAAEFGGAFFDSTAAEQKATLLPEVTRLRDAAQAELDGHAANLAALQQRVDVLNSTMTKLSS